jgi:fatty-acyl-CoA synthase
MFIPLTPIRCFLRALELYPNKVGVVSEEARYTYSEFADRSRRMAAGLCARGVKPGDRVAFLSFNTNVLLEGYLAVPLAGAILLPLNVRLHFEELKVLVEHAQPRVLLYEKEFASQVDGLREAAPGCTFLAIDGEGGGLDSLFANDPLPFPDLTSIDENAIAELFYTSGSTGRPKGVTLSHRTLYLHALSIASTLNHSDRQVILHTIPLFHANGWGFPHFATMCGFKHVMVRRFDPPTVFKLIEEEAATVMILVPTMAMSLLNCPRRPEFDVSSVEQILVGGAASSPELITQLEEAFPCATVVAGYGLTETSPVVSTGRAKGTLTFEDDAARRRFSSRAGWPFVGVEVRVVDGNSIDVERDSETVGELIVRGDNVMDGYYLDPELTREVIVDGWFHTGDMAVWDREDCVHVVDRQKDIIISGGENIASIEIELVLQAHPAVAECAVVAAPNDRWGEVPVAIVVLREGASANSEELLAFAATRLARFKMPQQIVLQHEPLPKNGTGKIMKRALREPFWIGKERRVQG